MRFTCGRRSTEESFRTSTTGSEMVRASVTTSESEEAPVLARSRSMLRPRTAFTLCCASKASSWSMSNLIASPDLIARDARICSWCVCGSRPMQQFGCAMSRDESMRDRLRTEPMPRRRFESLRALEITSAPLPAAGGGSSASVSFSSPPDGAESFSCAAALKAAARSISLYRCTGGGSGDPVLSLSASDADACSALCALWTTAGSCSYTSIGRPRSAIVAAGNGGRGEEGRGPPGGARRIAGGGRTRLDAGGGLGCGGDVGTIL